MGEAKRTAAYRARVAAKEAAEAEVRAGAARADRRQGVIGWDANGAPELLYPLWYQQPAYVPAERTAVVAESPALRPQLGARGSARLLVAMVVALCGMGEPFAAEPDPPSPEPPRRRR